MMFIDERFDDRYACGPHDDADREIDKAVFESEISEVLNEAHWLLRKLSEKSGEKFDVHDFIDNKNQNNPDSIPALPTLKKQLKKCYRIRCETKASVANAASPVPPGIVVG